MRQLAFDFDNTPATPTSAPLRIPDNKGGWLWLVPGSLLAGKPEYIEDEGLPSDFVDLTQDQDEVWRKAEAYHNGKLERAA